MVDREKAIKGLECHKRAMYGEIDEHGTACNSCPYKDMESTCHSRTEGRLIKDALALLKAQEARVMTLDEAKSAFVIEYRSGKLKEAGMTILDLDVDPANAHYGVIYRVWTSRPTDEQREATPWEQ